MDFILIDGDIAMFDPLFGAAIVTVLPGNITASGPASFNQMKLCVDGDEATILVAGCPYMTPSFPVPGVGTLTIDSLAPDQVATKTRSGGKYVLLKGGNFNAKFTVQSPAILPAVAPVPDPMPQYMGFRRFVTTNTKFRGT